MSSLLNDLLLLDCFSGAGELELSSSDDDKPDNQLGMKLKSPITKTVSPDPLDVKNTLTIEILVNNLVRMPNLDDLFAMRISCL